LKNKGWMHSGLGQEGNFRQGSSIEEGTRERAGEADMCNWSQVNEARVKGSEQSSSSRLSILLLPLQA